MGAVPSAEANRFRTNPPLLPATRQPDARVSAQHKRVSANEIVSAEWHVCELLDRTLLALGVDAVIREQAQRGFVAAWKSSAGWKDPGEYGHVRARRYRS